MLFTCKTVPNKVYCIYARFVGVICQIVKPLCDVISFCVHQVFTRSKLSLALDFLEFYGR